MRLLWASAKQSAMYKVHVVRDNHTSCLQVKYRWKSNLTLNRLIIICKSKIGDKPFLHKEPLLFVNKGKHLFLLINNFMTKLQVNIMNNKLRMVAVDKKNSYWKHFVKFWAIHIGNSTDVHELLRFLMDRLHFYNLYYIKV